MSYEASFSSSDRFTCSSTIRRSASRLRDSSSSQVFASFGTAIISPFSYTISIFFSGSSTRITGPPIARVAGATLVVATGLSIFFVFVVTLVLSSVTFLLGLLRGNIDPLFFSSVSVGTITCASFVSVPGLQAAISSRSGSGSLLGEVCVARAEKLGR